MGTLLNLFTGSREREAYLTLRSLIPPNQKVFSKVRLADVIDIEDTRLDQGDKDFALKASFDLLVVDKDYQPIHAVELHGAHHAFEPQRTRDERKRRICRIAGLPLTEIPNSSPSIRAELVAVAALCQPGATHLPTDTSLEAREPEASGERYAAMPRLELCPEVWTCFRCGTKWTKPWSWAPNCLHCGKDRFDFP